MVINIAVCDDEEFYAKELCSTIKKYTKWDGHSYTLHIFSSGEQTSDAIRNGLKVDILFIDIKLDDSSLGTDIGAKLKISNPDMLVVYMSEYDSYYKELACAEPFDFIYIIIVDSSLFTCEFKDNDSIPPGSNLLFISTSGVFSDIIVGLIV